MTTLLVPLDGSNFGEAALGTARRLAHCADDQLILLHVLQPNVDAYAAHEYLSCVAARLLAEGLGEDQVRVCVRIGEPVQAIASAARETAADLVVMATHGRSGLERQALGSVAGGVLRSCLTPVAMVRPASLAHDEDRGIDMQLRSSCSPF